ncbi:AraC family transcriptional regulator [Brevundimonas sp.]|jgi:AraC-like DNA-binding protein|uniref:AraC family transcriptional regulator n=1 Tax=Brevundimonas sp. TaxID=1871086 RepID=UPI002E0E5A59|nr:AraC family transcriptional regulator [Brevundimonas sp.]
MSLDRNSWIVRAPGEFERFEACLEGAAYGPHRHDTYAIAITVTGVQSFSYRGSRRHSLPGQIVVLHPDELHDGHAGDGRQFRYRSASVAPSELQKALGGGALPFLAEGVSDDRRLQAAATALIGDLNRALGGLEYDQAMLDLAEALSELGSEQKHQGRVDIQAVALARAFVDAHPDTNVRLDDLERVSGQDRWQLSRGFRALLGVSPYRYLIFRRLDAARALMNGATPLAEIAAATGFADQSHLTRHFRSAYGLTPAQWRRLNRSRPA